MKPTQSLLIISLVAIALSECKKTDSNEPQQTDCQPPTTLVAKAPCESGYPGVQLVASDFKGGSQTQFIYSVFVQKDTLSNDHTRSSYANASNERIIISEAILKDAPKFAVQVTINCGTGKDYPSRYFTFIKRPATNSGCYVWTQSDK